ncbi:DUF3667 domain-containing protein [Pseudoalteromonas sp. McH1-7]|uniref:DUF3667 domain-containing protein n=1 Tax=Pseudoalteromonas sp. McH1-7 TaxID=2745574 RepID=UPI0015919483|nr:DUF3667 domain-containing protein [Pseudoalteromonas sp. McH1-7]NUZ11206.1 DUF3667 domain-containing protein [Pseudoalteromonas sp. McH1-7]
MDHLNFENQSHCLNCHTPLAGEYCSGCGQKRASRLTFKHLGVLLQSALFDLESPFFRLLFGLLLQPFSTIIGYLNGQRSRFGNPFKFSFILLTVIVLASHLLETSFISSSQLLEQKEQLKWQSEIALYEATHIYRVFILAFLLGLASKLVYRSAPYTMLEYTIGHLLILTLSVLIFSIPLMLEIFSEQLYAILSLLFSALYSIILNYKMAENELAKWKNWGQAILAYAIGSTLFSAMLTFLFGVYSGFTHKI